MNSLLDWLIRKHLPLDEETLTRARITVGLLLFNVIVLSLVAVSHAIYIVLVNNPDTSLTLQVVATLLPTWLLYMGSLLHFGRTLSFAIAANIFLLSQFSILLAAVLMTGGTQHSPITPLLVIVAQYAFLLIGLRGGLLWSALVLLGLVALAVMDYIDIDFPMAATATLTRSYDIVAPILLLLVSTGALLLYEYLTQRLRTDLAAERNQLAWQSIHDPLTGLTNRDEFNRSLQRAIGQAKARAQQCAVIYIDLDNFKPINDRFGHMAGDHVLCEVAARLRQCVRESDVVARLGGDEFAVILPALRDVTQATKLAMQIQRTLQVPIPYSETALQIGASFGIATYPEHAATASDLLHHADAAMYDAKHAQRARAPRQ